MRGGQPMSGRSEWIAQLSSTLPETFVVKPAKGVYGERVTAWTRVDGDLVDHTGERLSFAELLDSICSDSRYDCFIIQERLENHAELIRLTGSAGLQTIRLVTFVDGDGQVHLTDGALKLIVGNQVIDNIGHGTTGNVWAGIVLEQGVLGPAVAPSPDGLGYVSLSAHPVTGLELAGFVLPDWSDLITLVLRCARLFLPLRTVGWDVALTTRGPVVVEGNRWWDPPNDMLVAPGTGNAERERVMAVAAALRNQDRSVSLRR